MQIKITLASDEKINLPIAYRHAQQSLLYNDLRSCPCYSHSLHNRGTSENTTGFKLFTFSPLEGSYTKVDKRIIFDSRVSFEIRCHDPFMAQLLLSGFEEGKTVTLLHNEMIVKSCFMENRVIFDGSVTVKTVSPIAVLSNTTDGHTVYYSPEDDAFYERIIANAKRKWCALYDEKDFSLNISSDGKHFQKLVTLFKGTYVNAWYGTFVLEGNPRVIDFLYNVGLGNKTSQGFGMFEILG
jgi:CRISPR-associated endoribonuclease Cas6